jgi:predicted Fe-Mo cluster-binding NifX family protein
MKIAVASEGKEGSSRISGRGGRAPYYLFFKEGILVEAVKNPFAMGGGGVGWSVAHFLADKDVKIVIAGKIGTNMQRALNEKGLKFKESEGIVEEVVKSFVR